MPCQFGKQTALPFNNSVSHALSSFDLIHSNVWGPSPIPTSGGSRSFIIFVDDFSRYTWIYLFKNRYELYQIYCDFTKMIETQFSKPINVFRSDNAQEYKAHEITSILHQFGNVPHFSCAGTSQQNGRVERKLRHILDVVRATTIAASTPSQFWGEAALNSVYTINRCPSPIVQIQTPYDLLFSSSPSYDLPRVFGCIYFVLLRDHERNKLHSRSRLCCFLRYGLVKKVIGVMISLANIFVFLGMRSFRNTKCFTNYLMFLFPLFSLSILSLTFFLRSLPPLYLSLLLLLLMFLLMQLMSFPHRSSTCPLILP